MKVVTTLAIATVTLSGVLFSGNALAARNNNAPLTGPGSTIPKYVQPPRYVLPQAPKVVPTPPRFVPAPAPKRYPSCTGAGSLSTSCR
jgi:hypothetical protein